MNGKTDENLPIPCAASASEERAAMVEYLAKPIALATFDALELQHYAATGELRGVASLIDSTRKADAAAVAAGEHLRGKVKPVQSHARDFREAQERLVARWSELWTREPEETRAALGPVLAVSLAGRVAAEYVEALSPKNLDKLHEWIGMPPEWSRPHAVATLTGFLFQVYGGIELEKQQRGDPGKVGSR